MSTHMQIRSRRTAAAALAAAAGATLAAMPASAAAGCVPPAPPRVTAIGTNSAILTSVLAPRGIEVHGQFSYGPVDSRSARRTYAVMLGHGATRVAWRMPVYDLAPGRRYVVHARAVSRGCSAESTATFRTKTVARVAPAEATHAIVSFTATEEPSPSPADEWNW